MYERRPLANRDLHMRAQYSADWSVSKGRLRSLCLLCSHVEQAMPGDGSIVAVKRLFPADSNVTDF